MSDIKKNKTRNANMDLLRIFSMFLIIFLHSIDHSGVLEQEKAFGGMMYFYVRFTYYLCMVCVNLYVMLSGYFMIKSKFRFQKLIVLWIETVFYSLIVRVIFMSLGIRDFSVSSLISCFVPIITGRYWFLTIYFGMYVLSPFINKFILSLGKKNHGILISVLFVLFSLISSLPPTYSGMNSGGGWGLAWFVVLYITASWFRLYYSPKNSSLKWFALYISISLFVAAFTVAADGFGINMIKKAFTNQYEYSSVFAFLSSVFIFVAFLNIEIKSSKASKIITTISPLTFGVYLIHKHADFSWWGWDFLDLPSKMGAWYFPLIQVSAVICIFSFCAMMDFIRKKLFAKIEESELLKKAGEKITKFFINTNYSFWEKVK